jgi:hypothetical protein
VDIADASFDTSGGDGHAFFTCQATAGRRGDIAGDYYGPPDPTKIAHARELEPNNSSVQAQQPLFAPVMIEGTISPDDNGAIVITFFDGSSDDLEDLYVLSLHSAMLVKVKVTPASALVNLDLYIMGLNPLRIRTYRATTASSETIDAVDLAAGSYLIGVSQSGSMPVGEHNYTLQVIPTCYQPCS